MFVRQPEDQVVEQIQELSQTINMLAAQFGSLIDQALQLSADPAVFANVQYCSQFVHRARISISRMRDPVNAFSGLVNQLPLVPVPAY